MLLGLICEEKRKVIDLGSFEPEDRKEENEKEYVLGLQAECNAATELRKASMEEFKYMRPTISEFQKQNEDAQRELEDADFKLSIIPENWEEANW